MKLIADKRPETSRECLFSIFCSDKNAVPNCMLRIENEYNLTNMSFSYTPNGRNCLLHHNMPCPFIKSVSAVMNDISER